MKIAPLMTSDPWYGRIVKDDQLHTDALKAVPVECTVEMELVELLHGGPETNHRPYLHLRGELTEAKPVVELPYGVSELTMRRGSGLAVDAFYDFTPEQLSDLVAKGYFTSAFRVPDEMAGIPWALPAKADFLVVAPELQDQPPLVFMNVHHVTGMEFDEANSGYELAAYFPDYSAEAQQGEHTADTDLSQPERGGSGLDVFSDIALPEHDVAAFEPLEEVDLDSARSLVPDGVFSRLVSEIQAQYAEPEPDPIEAVEEEATGPGRAWDLYISRISPGVEHVISGQHLEEPEPEAEPESDSSVEATAADEVTDALADDLAADVATDDVFQDALVDGEEEPAWSTPAQQADVSEEEQLKAARRRANQLRVELAEDSEADVSESEPTR